MKSIFNLSSVLRVLLLIGVFGFGSFGFGGLALSGLGLGSPGTGNFTFGLQVHAQHTFSIVAVDPITGEVGSAGATCLNNANCGGCGGARIISQLTPGKGAINAQASVCIPNSNALAGNNSIAAGMSASQVLSDLLANDNCGAGDTSNRQYGIITLDSNNVPEVSAFTGSNALSFAGHRTGTTYAIQGNILIGPHVLDSMEARYLATAGQPLCDRLMAALQGANIPGADSRCLSQGVSSLSAYIKVAKPTDGVFIWLNLSLAQVPAGVEPIDSLNNVFDDWKTLNGVSDPAPARLDIYPNPSRNQFKVAIADFVLSGAVISVYDQNGRQVYVQEVEAGQDEVLLNAKDWAGVGIYLISVEGRDDSLRRTGKVFVY